MKLLSDIIENGDLTLVLSFLEGTSLWSLIHNEWFKNHNLL